MLQAFRDGFDRKWTGGRLISRSGPAEATAKADVSRSSDEKCGDVT